MSRACWQRGKLAGYHGVTAFAEFAQALSQEQLRALRAYYSHRLQRFTAPTATTFHNILATLDPDVLDRAVRTWAEHRTNDKRHGRLETRTCRVLDLSTEAQGCKLPHRRVAFRIERERKHRKTGVVQHETVHGLTSLPFEQASAERMLELVRGHWSIENRLHHVRDVSYDEDRCRVHTGHLPRNLACLTNLAISIVRLEGRFDYLPQAHRHHARRPEQAVRHLLEPMAC